MKRITGTSPDNLAERLDDFLDAQPVTPSLSKVVQTALEKFLNEHEVQREEEKRGHEPPRWPVTFPVETFPVGEKGSGKRDISINYDKYLAEAAKDS